MDQQLTTQSELVDQWAKFLIERWQKQLKKRGIGKSGELYNSFVKQMTMIAPDVARSVDLKFLYYGRMVDMGVGKGTKIPDVKENARPLNRSRGVRSRKANKWYSPTFAAELRTLTELLAKNYHTKGVNTIEKGLREQVNIDL